MLPWKLKSAMLLGLLAALINQPALGGDCCCSECGCNDGVRKVCRLVCETKKIETVCYGCECEDFCLPGKSCRGCLNSEEVCAEGCSEDCCAHKPLCNLEWFNWTPGCAKVHNRKKLVKYIVVKEVPSYKWKVEEVCAGCCPDSACAMGADGVPVERAADASELENAPAPPGGPVAPASFGTNR